MSIGPWPDDRPLPHWTTLLRELATEPPGEAPDEGVPFGELLAPFLRPWQRRLDGCPGAARLAPAARAALRGHLLRLLADLFARPLLEKLRARTRATGLSRLLAAAAPAAHDGAYRALVEHLQGGGWVAFFEEFPVLGRLAATLVASHAEGARAFLAHLEADLAALSATTGRALARVTDLEAGLSDRHHGGRTVFRLTWEGGARCLYKPRGLALDLAWEAALRWLDARLPGLPHRVPWALDRGDHGWVEHVEARPCRDRAEVARFYQRSGRLLCLLAVLGAVDFHAENLVASGDQPVLVDLETLLQPRLARVGDDDDGPPRAAVLATGMLPSWDVGPDGHAQDVSALGGVDHEGMRTWEPRWRDLATDAMRVEVQVARRPGANAPGSPDLPVSPEDHLDDVVAGFARAWEVLAAERDRLLAPGGALEGFVRAPLRFVFRATRGYAACVRQLLEPASLRDGVEASLGTEVLARALLAPDLPPALWPVLRAEQEAVLGLDVPLFGATADDDALTLEDGRRVPGAFLAPAAADLHRRLARLGPEALALELACIRGAFQARVAHGARPRPSPPAAGSGTPAALTADDALARAAALADDLARLAVRDRRGATWLGLAYAPDVHRFRLVPMGPWLYDGTAGVALFLGALAQATGLASARALCLEALAPWLHAAPAHLPARPLGAATGVGSLIYALVRVAGFLQDPSLLDAARRLVAAIDVARDHDLDVMSGAAGAILGLLALHREAPGSGALDVARACGERLLDARGEPRREPRAWPGPRGRALAGMSHGAAGVAMALFRLASVSNEQRFREAALEGVAWERARFSREAGNWPDLRDEYPRFLVNWCNGASGVGLARLGARDAALLGDVEVALARTREAGLAPVDHLCCGTAGRIELLVSAGRALGRPALVDEARSLAAAVFDRAAREGGFDLWGRGAEAFANPGLFQGVAGLGYLLLRLSATPPPGVLAWE